MLHSHLALSNDVNEATSPVTPSMMMIDAFVNIDKGLYQALAGDVTSLLLLHGSVNLIGGQAVVLKNKFGADRDAMLFQRHHARSNSHPVKIPSVSTALATSCRRRVWATLR